jgi:hypothetical protein
MSALATLTKTETKLFLRDPATWVIALLLRLDRDGYIADPASVDAYAIEDVVVTGADDVIVATYLLSATVTIDEVTRTTTAPRLSTFARHGDDWLMSAHANFSPLAEDAEASPAP